MSATTAHPPSVHAATTPMVRAAAIGACGMLLGFAGLQVALAAGAPLGEHVWGGTLDPRVIARLTGWVGQLEVSVAERACGRSAVTDREQCDACASDETML